MSQSVTERISPIPSDSVITINNNFKKLDVDNLSDDRQESSLAATEAVVDLAEKTDNVNVSLESLQEELESTRKALRIKDEECKELSSVRSKVESELEELTASLFQEAHKMVNEANVKQFVAEKRLKEATGEIEALRTEVSALKSLVLTSTPSNPNPECHPQLIKKKKEVLGSPLRKHRALRKRCQDEKSELKSGENPISLKLGKEVDLVVMDQLASWLSNLTSPSDQNCQSSSNSSLLARIDAEDVVPCLTFSNSVMSQGILTNVRNNTLMIEPLLQPITQRCLLTNAIASCKHRIKCGASEDWIPISLLSRARIAAVCDYLTYIRYIEQKIVNHDREQMYWEIMRLRKEMCQAKFGFYKTE